MSTKLNCFLQILPDVLGAFQINTDSCISRDKGLSSPLKPGLLLRGECLGWLLQPGLEKQQLPSASSNLPTPDSSEVTQLGPKISQPRRQNSVLPALLRSLAPALTPPLLVLPLLTCGSPVVLYKVCGVRNRASRSEYVPVCVCPAIEEANTGWKEYRGKTGQGKSAYVFKIF